MSSVSPVSISRHLARRRRCSRWQCSWPASCRLCGQPGWTRTRCCEKSRKSMDNRCRPLITLEGATKVFHTDDVETRALDGISLEIHAGEYVSIAGPSGCGKRSEERRVGK